MQIGVFSVQSAGQGCHCLSEGNPSVPIIFGEKAVTGVIGLRVLVLVNFAPAGVTRSNRENLRKRHPRQQLMSWHSAHRGHSKRWVASGAESPATVSITTMSHPSHLPPHQRPRLHRVGLVESRLRDRMEVCTQPASMRLLTSASSTCRRPMRPRVYLLHCLHACRRLSVCRFVSACVACELTPGAHEKWVPL